MKKLTDKQKRFCQEYMIDLVASEACKRAGYKTKNNADKIGSELLGKTRVKQEITRLQKEKQASLNITQDRVLNEFAKIAFSNISDYMELITKGIEKKSEDEETDENDYKIQSLNFFDTAKISEDKLAAVMSYKSNKNGIEIKLQDKVKALESLAKHLGLFDSAIDEIAIEKRFQFILQVIKIHVTDYTTMEKIASDIQKFKT